MLGFTMPFEMCYTNILNMLDLAGIPLLAKDRGEDDPIVVSGGPCVYNAEPVADFFDVFFIGESEEAIGEMADIVKVWKKEGKPGDERKSSAAWQASRAATRRPSIKYPTMKTAFSAPLPPSMKRPSSRWKKADFRL